MPSISRAALINFQPHNAHAHGEFWVTLLEKCDFDGAIAEFGAAIRLQRGHAATHGTPSNALERKHDAKSVVAEYHTAIRLRLERANHAWSYDFVNAVTHDGRTLRLVTLNDEFTREGLAIRVTAPAAADLDDAVGRARAGAALAISALRERQARGAAGARGAEGFDFHGGAYSDALEEARPVSRVPAAPLAGSAACACSSCRRARPGSMATSNPPDEYTNLTPGGGARTMRAGDEAESEDFSEDMKLG